MKESAARTRILDVASRLFYEQGYNSTGINQVIDEANIARGSLYNHFNSKRDLLTAYIEREEDLWFKRLDDHLASIKEAKAKLLALFDFRMERQHLSNFAGCQFTKIGAEMPKEDLKAFEQVSHQKDRFRQYIRNLVQEVNLSEPQVMSRELLADTLFLLLEGATATASVKKEAEAISTAKKIAESLL